jgi:hypothetical protein
MRKLITAMKISLDGKFEGPQGYADWVSAWSDDYGLTPEIDHNLRANPAITVELGPRGSRRPPRSRPDPPAPSSGPSSSTGSPI